MILQIIDPVEFFRSRWDNADLSRRFYAALALPTSKEPADTTEPAAIPLRREEIVMIVGVIGSGAIGPDLAYGFVSALAGDPDGRVILHDIKTEALEAGLARIQGYVKKGVDRGKLSPKVAAAIGGKLVTTEDLADLADCDYVLEAATEDLEIKKVILANVEKVVRPDCLIGFATSGLPRARIAADTTHPERCFVNHPFFPAWRAMPIEVVLSEN